MANFSNENPWHSVANSRSQTIWNKIIWLSSPSDHKTYWMTKKRVISQISTTHLKKCSRKVYKRHQKFRLPVGHIGGLYMIQVVFCSTLADVQSIQKKRKDWNMKIWYIQDKFSSFYSHKIIIARKAKFLESSANYQFETKCHNKLCLDRQMCYWFLQLASVIQRSKSTQSTCKKYFTIVFIYNNFHWKLVTFLDYGFCIVPAH